MKTFLKLGVALVLFGVLLSALGVGIIRSHAVLPDSKASLSASAPGVASTALTASTVSASAATASVSANSPASASAASK